MRAIPDDNLAYPILITLSNGSTGSGFYLNAKEYLCLISAKHVLFDENNNLLAPSAKLLSYSKDHNKKEPIVYELNLEILLKNNEIVLHPDKDVVAIRLSKARNGNIEAGTYSDLVTGVKAIPTATKSGIIGAGIETIKKIDEVLIANEVFVFGYPVSLGINSSPQFDYFRPLLRRGIIAGIYNEKGTIILDCPVYPGNSGGPVVERELIDISRYNTNIIGVVSEFIPYVETWQNLKHGYCNSEISNSGYSVVTAMDSVFEILEFFKGRNT